MAEVRAGTDLRLHRPVAVKFLLPEMAARDDIRRRFEAEARAAASLSDPHAVAVYDTGEHEGLPYIVMERLPGETLADRIATGPQDPVWVRQVAGEVLVALGAAHAAGLVHRDVKPGNILITADNHTKVADFGIAKTLEASDGSLDLTGTGQLLGTPAYLPPERLDGGPATAQSDLYSLGVVLYEALTGKCPFPGHTPVAAAMAIVAGDYPPLDEVRPGLDPALVSAVQRAMATDPAQRFESAAAMAATLAMRDPTVAMVDDLTLLHAAAPGTAILDHPMMSETTEVPLAPPPPPVGRRRSRAPLAAALVALALVALLVAALNRGDGGAPNQPVSAQTETTQPAPTTVARSQVPQTTLATIAPSRPATTAPAAGSDKNDGKGKAKGKD
jgi:serine/threonine-protein kinase